MHFTLPQIRELDAQFPAERKLLLVPSINFGRELLAALAQHQGGWIGWEVATLGTIAQKLSLVELAKKELRRASDVAVADAVSAAFDEAVSHGEVTDALAALAWSAGTRSAVTDAILELRSAAVTSSQLRAVGQLGVVPSLAAVLMRFEAELERRGLADSTGVFNAAVAGFRDEAPHALDHAIMVCTPGFTVRGAPKALFQKLVEHGLRALTPLEIAHVSEPTDLVDRLAPRVESGVPVVRPAPPVTMFCAGTGADELREVVRRALANGHNLDDIEIACTDRDYYGAILESLSTQLGVNATFLDGLPLAATRVGRALERWFSWVESDYATEHIRGAIESGDWRVGDVLHAVLHAELDAELGVEVDVELDVELDAELGVRVASELRRLRIGWSLKATRQASERLRSESWRQRIPRDADEDDFAYERRRDSQHRAMDALAALLDLLLAQAPTLSGTTADEGELISVPEFAERTIRVLQLVRPHGPAETATLQRLTERLQEVAAVPRKVMPPLHALATLRQELSDLRAWTNNSNTRRPRRSTGGHLHLTNIDSAGATGRPLLFLVGLDADRTAGPVLQSPLLPDSLRNRLNDRGAELPTVEQRRRERTWQLATAMSGSSAASSFSYAIRSGESGRDAAPAPLLLHAARQKHNDANMSYDGLRQLLGIPVSAVPDIPAKAVDARDVVLAHMAEGALLLDGEDIVRELYPALNSGLNAASERENEEAGYYHGLVPAAGKLDPRRTGKPVSPSSLEMIASCSLRWFYAHALGAKLPEEPVLDAMVWLNVLDRGSALHTIYERIVRERLYEQDAGNSRRARVSAIVQEVADRFAITIPVPGAAVLAREIAALNNDAQLFVNSEHEAYEKEPWETLALESQFGDEEGATLPLDDGTFVYVHGRVDRVDKLADGTLRLVDYKTGRSFELDYKRGAFDGGRKLQLAVYSAAVSRQFGAVVSAAEYRFPTARGDGAVARADSDLLAAAPRIVRSLLDDVAAGRFVATIDAKDCAFCNYAAICRTQKGEYSTASPRAAWAKAHADGSRHYVGVLHRASKSGNDSSGNAS